MSARGRRARGRVRPDARGRCALAGRPITPSAVSRSSVLVASRPVSLATGTPRSVITTSCPLRARSSQELRCARRSVTVTSMPEAYTTDTRDLYTNLHAAPPPVSATTCRKEPNQDPTTAATRPHPATTGEAGRHARPRPATSSHPGDAPYKRGAGGSNPLVPTQKRQVSLRVGVHPDELQDHLTVAVDSHGPTWRQFPTTQARSILAAEARTGRN